MKALLYILAAAAVFGQAQTPFKIHQGGATAGQIWFQEPRASGTNWFKLRAGAMSADVTAILPTADGTANQCLSTDGAGQWGWRTCSGASVDLVTTDYDWYQTPGVSLTAATPATVTLTPCPAGASPYIAHYSLRIAGGTGAAETVLVTAVTGSGATCDVEFTPANNHTGSWTIGSASAGIQEAINYAVANTGHRVFIPNGVHTVDPKAPGEDSTIYIQGPVWMVGQNQSVNGGAELALNYDDQWAIVVTTAAVNYPVKLENFAIQGTGLSSSIDPTAGATPTGGGIKITASSGHNLVSKIRDIQFYTLATGLWCHKCAGTEITGNFFWGFLDYGIYLENTNNTDAGDYTITSNQFQVVYDGMTYTDATALHWASAGGAKIVANKFNLHGAGVNMTFANPSIITVIEGNSFDNQRKPSVKLRAGPGADGAPIGFLGAVISNNVVTGPGETSYIAFDVGDSTTDYLANVSVLGNTMQANDGTAIKIGDVQQVSVAGNVMGEFTTGIQVAATAVGFAHGKNVCYSVGTCYDIDAAADVRPTSPLFASGYGGWAASGTNIAAIAEFAPPATGEINNAILFQTNATGVNSQRGIWWDTAANMYLARFSDDRATTHTSDFQLESDGDARFYYNVGIGRTPPTGVALDVNGVIRSSDGTIINQLYTTGGAAYLGTQSNHSLIIVQDATERLRVTSTQLLPGLTDGYLYLGDRTLQFNTVFATGFESIQSSAGFMSTRKLQIHGDATGSLFDYFQKPTSTSIDLRNTSGNLVMRWDSTGITYNGVSTMYQLWPGGTTETLDLGVDLARWKKLWVKDIDGSGTATVAGLTINTGAATVGYCWTATSTGGAGSWQACAGSLPVTDTTGIAKGSSDATKIVRFEVDGLTTATTRVLTVPDADMTLAGRNVAQTFSAAQTVAANLSVTSGSSLLMDRATRATNQQAYWTVAGNPSTTGAWSIGTVPNGSASEFRLSHNGTAVWTASEGGQVDFAGTVTVGGSFTATGTASAAAFNGTGSNPFRVAGTTVIDSSRNASIVGLTITGRITGDVLPNTDGGYVSGSSSFRWGSIATYNADFNGVLTFQSGTTFTGSILPTTNNLYALGNSSFRLSNISTVNANFSGTVTAPSGATGYTGTLTVRAAGGGSDCTIFVSGGFLTAGGTC